MGLMDKFKNLFTDEEVVEEEDEVEIKEVKKEEKPKLPTFMREKIAKEEQEQTENDIPQVMKIEQEEIKKEIKLERKIDDEPKEEKSFKFPLDLNENDFMETRTSRQSLHAKERELEEKQPYIKEEIRKEKITSSIKQPKKELKVSEIYKDKKEEKKKEDKRFRATPIISPIYGVLDKNYDPQDVENNKGHNLEDARPSKSVDFDSVRKKAYGSITEEIKENLICENCEYLKEAKECKNRKQRYIYQDTSPEYETEDEYINHSESEYENITMDEAAENYYDYGVEYEKKPVIHNELNDENNYYLNEEIDDNQSLEENESEKPTRKKEIPPVKSSINLLSTLKKSMGDEPEKEEKKEKNLELTDDLFNLIDSMYDERNDK